jgi:hypothetical protein
MTIRQASHGRALISDIPELEGQQEFLLVILKVRATPAIRDDVVAAAAAEGLMRRLGPARGRWDRVRVLAPALGAGDPRALAEIPGWLALHADGTAVVSPAADVAGRRTWFFSAVSTPTKGTRPGRRLFPSAFWPRRALAGCFRRARPAVRGGPAGDYASSAIT